MEYELLPVISVLILLTLTFITSFWTLYGLHEKSDCMTVSRSTILIPLLTGTTITRNLINLSCQQNGRVHTLSKDRKEY